jgi:hypothetical protein
VQTESAISLEIPKSLAGWECRPATETKAERDTLAPDTKFSKADCFREKPGKRSYFQTDIPHQYADISIVLSGYDLANSIHRPERCMPAQGHLIHSSEKQQVEVKGHGVFPVRRLLSTKEDVKDGRLITQDCVTYYFFVGHDRITEDHTRRTIFDISDRMFKGQAQRWAYVSVSTQYRGNRTSAEGLPDLAEADVSLQQLMSELVEANVAWEQIGGEGR